jgi:8-oxo-dGTP pyrophosphatase MutT (NUDIX family)
MLLRDISGGIEVFMLRRTTAAAFASGMYVFPGGKVDAADGEGDIAFVMAAIRECYEEAGVLLATDESGNMVTDGHPALAHRQAVYDGVTGLRGMCEAHGLRPAVEDLVWQSRWITPIGEATRRFDTRFYVAAAPASQTSRHDDNETIASAWVRPVDALHRHRAGELMMMVPTVKNLEFLAAHDDSASVLAAARTVGRPEPILPRLRRDAGGRIVGVSLPEDQDYADLA